MAFLLAFTSGMYHINLKPLISKFILINGFENILDKSNLFLREKTKKYPPPPAPHILWHKTSLQLYKVSSILNKY